MDGIAQHSVNESRLAGEIEPLAVASWPAQTIMRRNGWLLRFAQGFSARANSVSTLDYSGLSLPDSIAAVEAAYRTHSLAPQFQITPATKPGGLERALRERGYVHKSPTILMAGDTAAIADRGDVQVCSEADPDFVELTREGSHSRADGDERLATLKRVASSKAFFLARDGATAVGCGASVATGNWAGVYVMRTTLGQRRRGHGSRVLRAIAAWALTQGAAQMYLQVDATNAAGRALYARAGFRDGYRVLHYVAPEAKP